MALGGLPRTRAFLVIATLVAAGVGGIALATDDGMRAPEQDAAAEALDRSHAIFYIQSIGDWVSHADTVAVVTVTGEHEVDTRGDGEAQGQIYTERLVDLQVDSILWSTSYFTNRPTLDAGQELTIESGTLLGEEREPATIGAYLWLEVGETYVVALAHGGFDVDHHRWGLIEADAVSEDRLGPLLGRPTLREFAQLLADAKPNALAAGMRDSSASERALARLTP